MDVNTPFVLGCLGMLVTVAATIWIVVTALQRRHVPGVWLAAYVALAAVSFGAILLNLPFVDVISRVSTGGGEESSSPR
jgi:hypothetical protein